MNDLLLFIIEQLVTPVGTVFMLRIGLTPVVVQSVSSGKRA